MIHVCFCFHDRTGRYSKFTGTAMLSMFESHNTPHLPSITVHILHDDTLTPENRDKFFYVAGQYGQLVKLYNVERLCADKIAKMIELVPSVKTSWGSVGAFYRLLIPQLLSTDIDKVIYLDSDIIVNMNIAELWQVELGEYPLAVVPEIFNKTDTRIFFPLVADGKVKGEEYFNSGVLLMNLKLLRKEEDIFPVGVKFIAENPRYKFYMDQDILNYLFASRALKLPKKFNRFAYVAGLENNSRVESNIYHYVPKPQALGLSMNFALNRLWMHYFMKTPWFDEETIGRLYTGVQKMNVDLKQSMVNLSSAMSGKTRAFFVAPANVDVLKKIFSIRDDEEVITADSQESLNKLLDAMKRARGKKIFFILLPNFPLQILTQAGFAQGKDFVNGLDFLSEAQGVPFNSYPLVQAM